MAKYTFVVMTNAVEGRDDDFNAWYDSQHIGDVLKLDGFVSAQRFTLPPEETNPVAIHRYLTLYEIETDDLAKTQAALGATAGTPAMPLSDALDTTAVFNVFYRETGDKILANPG
jgi:hypothetical protein